MNHNQKISNLKRLQLLLMAALTCAFSMNAADNSYPGLSERIEQFNLALQAEDIAAVSAITVPKERGVFFPLYYYSRLGMERWDVLRIIGIMSEEMRYSEKRLPYRKVLVVTRLKGSDRNSGRPLHSVAVDYWFVDSGEWRVVPIEITLSNVNFEFDTGFLQYFIQTPEEAVERYQDYSENIEKMQQVRDKAIQDDIKRHLDSRKGAQ